MTQFFPVLELFDRLAIAEVKWQKTQSNKEELEWYINQTNQFDFNIIRAEYEALKEIHNTIWGLEAELKSGNENNLDLAEIGKRAIMIRDYNNKRITIKNQIAELLNCTVREIKKDHLSE